MYTHQPQSYQAHFKDTDHGFTLSIHEGEEACSVLVRIAHPSVKLHLHKAMPPLSADILDIGFAIQAVDRMCPRGKRSTSQAYGYWAREVCVTLPVRYPNIWNQIEIRQKLASLLKFVTDDVWEFEFICRSEPDEAQRHYFRPSLFDDLSSNDPGPLLFSGGIDSTYGLFTLLQNGHDAIFPVTVTNNGRVANRVESILNAFVKKSLLDLPRVKSISPRMCLDNSEGLSLEDSARARGIQFVLAGVALAIGCGSHVLYVSENGMGALSLSMTSDHFGSRATKAMHPQTLAMIAEIISLVYGDTFEVVNLGLNLTKGEMIAELVTDPISMDALARTSTCDHRLHRGVVRGCGRCTSCLLRRIGFHAASIDDPIHYDNDLLNHSGKLDRAASALEYHAQTLRDIQQTLNPLNALAEEFPQIKTAIPYFPETEAIQSLIRRYTSEIGILLSDQARMSVAA